MPSRLHRSPSHPAGSREQSEGDETGHGIGDQLCVGEAPLPRQNESGDRRKDQREQMIEEVAGIQKQKTLAVFHGGVF